MKDYFKRLNTLTLSDMRRLNDEAGKLLSHNDEKFLAPEKRMRKLGKKSNHVR